MKAPHAPRSKPARQKRVQPQKPQVEYLLLISQEIDARTKKPVTVFAIRTVRDFTSFRYDLLIDLKIEKTALRFKIEGLRAPRLTMPGFGPARFESRNDRLTGSYEVVVWKLAKDKNVFRVVLKKKEVVVDLRPEKRFIDIITRREDFD